MAWFRTIYMLPEAARTRQCMHCKLAALYEVTAANGVALRTGFFCEEHARTITQKHNLNFPTKPPRVYEIPPGTDMKVCRTCSGLIRWITTPAGKPCPVNLDGTPHHASCPFADQHRKKP